MFFSSCPISPHWPRERQRPSGLPWSWESPKGPNLLLVSRSHQTISPSWVCHHTGSDAWVSHWDSHNQRGSNAWWEMESNGKPWWKTEKRCHRRLQPFKKPCLGTRFCISPCLGHPTRVSTFKQANLLCLHSARSSGSSGDWSHVKSRHCCSWLLGLVLLPGCWASSPRPPLLLTPWGNVTACKCHMGLGTARLDPDLL